MASYVAFVAQGLDFRLPTAGRREIRRCCGGSTRIGFGRLSVADGAKQFIAEANAVLARG
jgi:hypothetical protein